MNQKEVKRYLNVIKRAVSLIEGMLENDDEGLLEKLVANELPTISNSTIKQDLHISHEASVLEAPNIQTKISVEELQKQEVARKKHIEDLLTIDCWPEAVPPFLVAKDVSTEDQINRANAVLDMMLDKKIEDLNFLDFGCGDGWIAQEALKRGATTSVGYDIKTSKNWSQIKKVKFTQNISELSSSFFDVIMLYDVLDHCVDPVKLMSQVKNLLKKDGVVYVRCHPWVSKHATHMYKQGINKAYFHLFLNYNEIKNLISQEPTFTRTEKEPIQAYHWWFNDFEIKKERFVKEPVSDFFFVDSFKQLLADEQQIPLDQIDDFLKKLEIQFVDYTLKLK